jgi:large subunit ribosomal protein L29
MEASELRSKTEQELRDELLALRREQFNLRMQAGVNPEALRSDQIAKVRKNIARVKTVMNEKRGEA